MPSTDPIPTKTYTLSQQGINVIKQILNAKGWPGGLGEAYAGGKLVEKYLPSIDTTWVRSDADLQAMTPEEREAYQQYDKEWVVKPVTFELTDKQAGLVRKAFKHFIGELLKAKSLGPADWLMEIVDVLEIPLEDDAPKP